jgi:hypothetical protein
MPNPESLLRIICVLTEPLQNASGTGRGAPNGDRTYGLPADPLHTTGSGTIWQRSCPRPPVS